MKINIPNWIDIEALKHLFEVLGEGTTRLAGGAVRNAIMNTSTTDIDLATILTPDQVIKHCEGAGIKTILTGIDHGTITIVMKGQNFEITTLRKDVKTDGRHAEIQFTDDWLEDAKRRDFTMNALYMDLDGTIYDPLGLGLADVKAKKIQFVGDPAKRIAEDYLRILRFFRFYTQYEAGSPNEEALNACKNAAQHIETLSRERVTQEFLKIIATNKAADVLTAMFGCGVLKDLPNAQYDSETLDRLIALQKEQGAFHAMPRLYVLGGNKPSLFDEYLRLSHAQKKFLIKLGMATSKSFFENEKELKKAIFYHGNDLLIQGYILLCAIENDKIDTQFFNILKNWQAPKCPITGEALLAEGYQTGPELGQELNRRVEEWLEGVI